MGSSSVIPRNVAAYVGGKNDTVTSYALWKDGHLLVIQAAAMADPNFEYALNPTALAKLDQEYFFGLEKIQTLLDTIEFGKTNWAYLIPQANGGCRILQKNKSLYKISCPAWAPLIDESEIEITKWIDCEDRHGIWRGRKVEVFFGWEDHWLRRVDLEMRGHRALRGLDLTFEVLGHVVQDGAIVGLMTERATGRMVQFRDRALVYDAIARLQQRNLLYGAVSGQNIMIFEGKVRLLIVSAIRHFPESKRLEMEKEAEHIHWKQLEKLFERLEKYPNGMLPWDSWGQQIKILPKTPYPERPLLIRFTLRSIPEPQVDSTQKDSTSRKLDKRSLKDRSSKRRGPLLVVDSVYIESLDPDISVEQPLHSAAIKLRHPRAQLQFHPYRQRSMPRRMLLGSDDAGGSSTPPPCDSEVSSPP